jgi:glucose/arabinose dehydrogenase
VLPSGRHEQRLSQNWNRCWSGMRAGAKEHLGARAGHDGRYRGLALAASVWLAVACSKDQRSALPEAASSGAAGRNAAEAGADTGGAASSGGATTGAPRGSGGRATSGGSAATGGRATSGGGIATGGRATSGGGIATGGRATSGGAATGGSPVAGGRNAAGAGGAGSAEAGAGGSVAQAGGEALAGAGGVAGSQQRVATCPSTPAPPLAGAQLPSGYCAWTWASGLDEPRGILSDERGQLLVVESGSERVTLLWDDDGDHQSSADERAIVATAPGLTHGLALFGGKLYASSATTVYRWPYSGERSDLGSGEPVIVGLPSGGHKTRTLVFDSSGALYVSIGSRTNVDSDSSRARIVRFTPAQVLAGATLEDAELVADGTRNEVGLRFDASGRLWGVENGRDQLSRDDLGEDIHNDNPAEELNLFAEAGRFYGYPYCWTEGSLPEGVGHGSGTQWADPQFMDDSVHTDAWCSDETNVVRPLLTMQAHSAPLDLLFYSGASFPADVVGNAFVTFHGSWNRSPATGYKVVMIPFGSDGLPAGPPESILESAGAGDTGDDWPHRPVSLAVDARGELLVSSDESGVILAVGHE